MYTRILHATDLLDNHFDICKKAASIAHYFEAELHLLHVIEQPTSLQLAQSLGFAEIINPVKDDALTVMNILGEALNISPQQQHVEVGSLKMHLLETAKTLHCELIILGSHTHSAVPAFLGSTAYAMLHHASCDVLTLRVH